ncbi:MULTISPECIES: GAF domain-containing protein [unclassified Streptomyces]|uniref:GAF domain-containing protein n=1 Tax=unclassified Streptomyces TaxID=2593676 RepID=UPI002366F559|nr:MULTISPECIES: GAF domain-containing protein [unclassified Streptomyces]MDF3144894.1 GAF domain-containing protein [Streptomyces sp. T21Q-yed]WDF42992.1 GAF domain-containing protein [Streptomyces sp. T12]
MSYGPPRPVARLLLTPEDKEAPARAQRLLRLGLGEQADPALDVFADHLAALTGAPYAMVNFIGENRQFFAGLHVRHAVSLAQADDSKPQLGRHMGRDHGFCPHVVVRRKALVLEDVRDYPRFAGNPIVDEFGIRSYLGAPLIDSMGMALGTVGVVDVEPRPWGKAGLETIKASAAELAVRLERRAVDGLPL